MCIQSSATFKGTITLARTYAAYIDQSSCQLFWAIVAMKYKFAFSSDAVNAFKDAPPPKSPLYLKTDDAYQNWYKYDHNVE